MVSVADQLSAFVAHELSAMFFACSGFPTRFQEALKQYEKHRLSGEEVFRLLRHCAAI
jgi:hypothetical protein